MKEYRISRKNLPNIRFWYLLCLAVLADQTGLRSTFVARSALLDFRYVLVRRSIQPAEKFSGN